VKIDAIIAWDRRRYSFRVFLTVKLIEFQPGKYATQTESLGDFVMLLMAAVHHGCRPTTTRPIEDPRAARSVERRPPSTRAVIRSLALRPAHSTAETRSGIRSGRRPPSPPQARRLGSTFLISPGVPCGSRAKPARGWPAYLGGPHGGGGPHGTPLRLGTRPRHGRRAPAERRFTSERTHRASSSRRCAPCPCRSPPEVSG
jgi:hypothetical protein